MVPPPGAKYDANTKTVVHDQVAQVEEDVRNPTAYHAIMVEELEATAGSQM